MVIRSSYYDTLYLQILEARVESVAQRSQLQRQVLPARGREMKHLLGRAVTQQDTAYDDALVPHAATESQGWHSQDRILWTVRYWADRYEILGELSTRGSSAVYRVRDDKIGRHLALKLLSDTEEMLVVREAHALTALESPHILKVFNAGIYEDVPFIATDIAPMGSAEDQMTEGFGVAPELAVRWVRQALVGLGLCHRRNILHRDITPGNIFLDSQDHALLGDFGSAANIDTEGTAASAGNQRCRAPEGYGGRLTARSDLFSAGVTLWRLLTGGWPFDASTEDDLLVLMRKGPPRLREEAPHVHDSIAQVVQGALNPNPELRPSSADEMARLLSRTRTHPRNWVRHSVNGPSVEYRTTAGGSPIALVVTSAGQRRTIETRYIASDRRASKGCFETIERRLGIELRRLFDRVIV